jgi:hypothetical protein
MERSAESPDSAAGWWDTLWASAGLAALLILALAAYSLIPGWNPDGARVTRRFNGVGELRVASLNAVTLDAAQSVVRTTGPDPHIVFEPATGLEPSSFEMALVPEASMQRQPFTVYYIPARGRSNAFSDNYKAFGAVVEGPGGWRVTWTLPEPARTWRVNVPSDAHFHLNYFEASGDPRGAWARLSSSAWRVAASCGAGIALVLVVLQFVGRPFVPSARRIKTLLLLGLAGSLLLMTFLLPPFQGPDEHAHWKLALMFHRTSIAREPAAYYLAEALNTSPIEFNYYEKFQPQRLRQTLPPDAALPPMPAAHQYLLENYPYVRVISYPVVFLLSQLFPAITTTQQAMQFYYLARLIPAGLIVALLYGLNRRYELPYTAWIFFSLPLVVQQFVVISADTLLNIGAVAAVWLFLRLRERPSLLLTLALWGLCLTITFSKFLAAPVLIFPLWLVPYRKLPRPKLLLLFAVAVIIPLVYVCGTLILSHIKDVGRVQNRLPIVEQQMALVTTAEGMRAFLTALRAYFEHLFTWQAWSGPLGWLDTPLSVAHLSLIVGSGVLAMLLDVWTYGPQFVRLVRARTLEMTLFVGLGASGLLFAALSDAVVYYLMMSPAGGPSVVGTQVRHLFPAAMVAALMPLAMLAPWDQDVDRSRNRTVVIANTIALVLLSVLFVVRNIELAVDLLTRYWG